MRLNLVAVALCCSFANLALAQSGANPFVGNWDFDLNTPHGEQASWLGITEKDGGLDIWYQPTGGHVFQVKDYKQTGPHLTLNIAPAQGAHPALVWELDATDGKLTGTQKSGSDLALTGLPAPALDRQPPASWSDPELLFNGKNLDGWKPIGNANSNWVVQDGLLVNTQRGANLESTRKFTDFKAHFEVNCPDGANSGFYLRGRYEIQLAYEKPGVDPPIRDMGAIYGRITPSQQLPRKPGQWETFDVTLIGRTVTVVRDGVTIIDNQHIDGITGGALNADEGDPGPFYIQGDHTGGLKFRNITVQVPK